VYDESYPWHKAYERFRDTLRAKSRATIDVQIFPRGTLGNERDYVSYLRQGVLDVATVSTAALATLVPEVSFFDLMYLFRDADHWRRSLDGSLGQEMSAIIRRYTSRGTPGFEVLGYWSGSPSHIVGRRRGYQTLKDLEGMKIRNQGAGVQIEQWRLLGADPVTVAYDGVLTALKEGTLDATPGMVAAVHAMKFHEVAPHISETAHSFGVRITVMSGHTWNKLSEAQQAWVMEAGREATTLERSLEAEQTSQLTERLKTEGVTFYPFRDKALLRDRTQSVRQQFAQQHGLSELLAGLETEWDKSKR
jgi:tripartite ATP-independent transporter DctP family solute receptor